MSVSASADQATAGGNHDPTHPVRNPIPRRVVHGSMALLAARAERSGGGQVHEIGGGVSFLRATLARRGLRRAAARSVRPRRRSPGAASPSSAFRAADLNDLSPPDGRAEPVVCRGALEHLADPTGTLALLARLAPPHLIVGVHGQVLWRPLDVRCWPAIGNAPGYCGTGRVRGFRALLENTRAPHPLPVQRPETILRRSR